MLAVASSHRQAGKRDPLRWDGQDARQMEGARLASQAVSGLADTTDWGKLRAGCPAKFCVIR